MNIRDCEYIVAIAEFGHFGKAAEHCHVSQSTLSIQIKKLEELLGLRIFERTNRSVMLTGIGRDVYDAAKVIIEQAARMKALAAQAKNPFAGTLNLGIFPTLSPYLLPRVTAPLRRWYPDLKLFFIEEKTDILLQRLHRGELDCALLAMPVDDAALETRGVFHEQLLLAVPEESALAKQDFVSSADIAGEQMLLLEEGHCLRGQALAFCTRLGIGEAGSYRATSLETLRSMVVAGGGVTLIPKLAVRPNDGIRYLPFDEPRPGRTIGIAWRRTDYRQKLYLTVARTIAETVASLHLLD